VKGSVVYLEFAQDGLRLKTTGKTTRVIDLGTLYSQSDSENHASQLTYRSLEIPDKQRQWIKLNGEKVLWLPPEFRPLCSAIHGNLVALGLSSGLVSFIKFRV
jgi:hypothetical protein